MAHRRATPNDAHVDIHPAGKVVPTDRRPAEGRPHRGDAGLMLAGFCLLAGSAFAADLRLARQWTASDGLPLDTVNSLAIDGQGRLWIGSTEGLSRFDGFEFTPFNTESRPSLPGNRILRLFPFDDGLIVQFEDLSFGRFDDGGFFPIGTTEIHNLVIAEGAVWYIDPDRDRVIRWPRAPKNDLSDPFAGLAASAIRFDPHAGRMLIGTASGTVLAFDPPANQLRHLHDSNQEAVLGIAAAPDGRLLVADPVGLAEYLPDGDGFVRAGGGDWPLLQLKQLDIAWTQAGWIIGNVFTEQGTLAFWYRNGSLRPTLELPADTPAVFHSPVVVRRHDRHGRDWINLGHTLYVDGAEIHESSDRSIDYVVDDFDQVWLATARGGLQLLTTPVVQVIGNRTGELSDPNTYVTTWLDEQLLIGGFTELKAIDPDSGRWSHLWSGNTRSLLADGEDLLIGTGTGLCRLRRPGRCRPLTDFPAPDVEVNLLFRDRHGAVWAGTTSGLYRRDPGESWRAEPLFSAGARTALELSNGDILFGTIDEGVIALRAGQPDSRPRVLADRHSGLASNSVRALFAIDRRRVLVGLEDRGICLLDRESGIAGCASTAEGLPHHSTHKMIADDTGRLWVNTNHGIYSILLDQLLARLETGAGILTPRRFGRADGMLSIEGNGGVDQAGTRTPDGRIWFPNQQGVVVIDPSQVHSNSDRPVRALINTLTPGDADVIVLPPHDRRLEVRLSAVALADPHNVQFRYRLDKDADWVDLGPRRELTLSLMKPGRQRLKAQARYTDSDWLGETAELEFEVRPRLVERRALHAAVTALTLAALIWLWLRQRREREQLREQVARRTSGLNTALEQVGALTESIRQADFSHEQTLGAVSRELRALLNFVMEPLRFSPDRLDRTQIHELRRDAQSMESMIDQLAAAPAQHARKQTGVPESPEPQAAEPVPMHPLPVSSPAPASESESERKTHRPAGRLATIETEQDWLTRVRAELLRHLDDPDFRVEQLAARVHTSRAVFYRRLQALTGQSPAGYMRQFRLEQAAHMLRETDAQITQIAFATGFRRVSAFSRAFSRHFGRTPGQWRKPEAGQ